MENKTVTALDQYTVPDIQPWCIQLELVEGCNRRCWFCGLLSLTEERRKGTHFMDLGLLEKVFTELNEWLPKIRVEINSHGEPTLHPQFLDCLKVMRKAMPTASLNLQTNTEVWMERANDFIPAMWEAGLNVLALNAYKEGLYDWWKAKLEEMDQPYIDYYWDNPRNLSVNQYYPPHKQIVFLWDDLGKVNTTAKEGSKKHTNKKLHNSGGNSVTRTIVAKTKKEARPLPWAHQCSKVFRELILGWDGTVPICCQDWQDLHVMGNAKEESIKDIWYGDRFWAVRQLLHKKRRDLILPCANCNDPTTRPHLVPPPNFPLSNEALLSIIERTGPTTGTKGRQAPITLTWEGDTVKL